MQIVSGLRPGLQRATRPKSPASSSRRAQVLGDTPRPTGVCRSARGGEKGSAREAAAKFVSCSFVVVRGLPLRERRPGGIVPSEYLANGGAGDRQMLRGSIEPCAGRRQTSAALWWCAGRAPAETRRAGEQARQQRRQQQRVRPSSDVCERETKKTAIRFLPSNRLNRNFCPILYSVNASV